MGYGPYRYVNGQKLTYGSDGRWWLVTKSYGGNDYGYPMSDLSHTSHSHGYGGGRHHHKQRSVSAASPTSFSGAHSRQAASDPWGGSDYARQLFQGAGARYFIDADRAVTRLTEVYAAVYTAAFLSPQILAAIGPMSTRVLSLAMQTDIGAAVGNIAESSISPIARMALNQIGAFGSYARLFWSGGGFYMALRYGSQMSGNAGQILEESPLGSFATSVQSFLPFNAFTAAVWTWLSTGFAEGAEESAIYFEGPGGYQGQVWLRTELPRLLERLGGSQIRVVPYK